MRVQDLHVLPKFSDGWSYLYVEHCRIDQDARAIAVHDETGKVPVPFDQDAAAPGSLWDPVEGEVEGGRIHPLGV